MVVMVPVSMFMSALKIRCRLRPSFRYLLACGFLISACAGPTAGPLQTPTLALPTETALPTLTPQPLPAMSGTPLPTRTAFGPGEKLPYVTQNGDYVAALARRFNTTPEEILTANPGLPVSTTLPVGTAIQIPAYYLPLGGTPFKIIPDSEVVYGPSLKGFNLAEYLRQQPGSVKYLSAFVNQKQRDAAGTINYVARQYSINPRLILALMEWRTGALTNPVPTSQPFGPLPQAGERDWYLQMLWIAEQLSVGYYGWRTGELTEIPLPDAFRVRVDSYQNAGTVAVQYLLSQMVPRDEFEQAIGPEGFARTYRALWGDVWESPPDVLTGELVQPPLLLPFEPRRIWTLTGGPHPAWGQRVPWAALDFAPAGVTGCGNSAEFARASAAGVIVRAGDSTVVLDLDGDGDEGTGWVLFYFHLAERDLAPPGLMVKAGDPIGHPSCEGGTATGSHVHLARRYNGEWMIADGIVPFDLGGWVAVRGAQPYLGRLQRLGAWVEASTSSTAQNRVYWVP